jgi:predicted transcriptional regulator
MTEHTDDPEAEMEREDREYFPEMDDPPRATTLVITTLSEEDSVDAAVRLAREAAAADEPAPHRKNFEDPSAVRRLLTPRRLELIETLMHTTPESISALATALERNYREVYEDLQLLEDADIVDFEADGRAKRPVVPYERVRLEVEIGRSPEHTESVEA